MYQFYCAFLFLDWSLQSLFTKTLSSHCPLATYSSVTVDTTSNIPVCSDSYDYMRCCM